MDIIKFVQDILQEDTTFSSLDVSEGSNIYDILVVPLSNIISSEIETSYIDKTTNNLDLSKYKDMSIDELKILANNHMVNIKYPNKAIGYLTLKFSKPVTWNIPEGTGLSYGSIKYVTMSELSLSIDMFTKNGIYYEYYPVPVVNLAGENVPQDSLGHMEGAPSELLAISHQAISSGTQEDTKSALYQKISNSIYNRQLLSTRGISLFLKDRIPSLKDTEVVGKGDSLMVRDQVYNVLISKETDYIESTFVGKVRKNLNNPNKMYRLFRDGNTYTGAYTPILDDEIFQQEYNSIASEDGGYLTIATSQIINETFDNANQVVGEIQKLSADTVADSPYLNVDNLGTFEMGSSIMLIDPTGTIGASSNVVKEVSQKKGTISSYGASNTITLIGDLKYLRVGASIWIVGGTGDTNNTVEGTIATVKYNIISTVITITVTNGTFHSDATPNGSYLYTNVIECYSNIGHIYPISSHSYVQIDIGNSTYIGGGWVKSEHGMPIGSYLSKDEARVIAQQLYMGGDDSSDGINLLQDVLSKTGMSKFVDAVVDAIKVKIEDIKTGEIINVTGEGEISPASK